MVIPGKPHLEIRKLEQGDLGKLEDFLHECARLNLENNRDLTAIKFDKMSMPYGQYFIGLDHTANKIWNLAGIHQLPELGNNVWRALFRGAQLPGYALAFGKDFLKISYHFRYFLPMQIEFIKSQNPSAEFVISTNVKNAGAGKSDRLNKSVCPYLKGKGILTLEWENYMLFNTVQNIWKVNTTELTNQLRPLS
jgi:hypothetical protein